jgi:GntR family transcriptional regulator
MMDWNDKEPIYQQIKKRIEQQILSGVWLEGEALPSIRTVASDLKINHLTVMKAYQLLVDDLLVEKIRGRGMFVLTGAQAKLKSDKTKEFLNEQIPILIETLKLLDIPVNDFTQELHKQIKGNADAISESK